MAAATRAGDRTALHRHVEVRVTVQAVGFRFLMREMARAAGDIAKMGCMRIEIGRSLVTSRDLLHPAVTGRALRIDRCRVGVRNEIVAVA